ncbi:MAG: hypothetical protein LBU74_06035 [Methanobacteriaceae archaeon]|jgi:hypothetical protein|nr:hypothetical protein [Candidatus Methanorudis spinitermitis]
MISNLEKYKKDLENLINKGNLLYSAMLSECYPNKKKERLNIKDADNESLDKLPDFNSEYQEWYSEASIVIKQLLTDRLDDFKSYYDKPKSRKQINVENYCIKDYLDGITVSTYRETIVDTSAAIPKFQQQLAILKSVSSRFTSSLFDIQQLVQADLFDSELDAAKELTKKGFIRGAGAIAGVVLEKHLSQVMDNHNISTRRKRPTINDFNETLKNNNVIDVPLWRQIQRFGDIRNLCDHNKNRDPSKEEISELIDGVEKLTKTLF